VTRAWVGVVSRAHVQRGVAGGFAQLCHGKRAALARMEPGDWLVYYSPTTELGAGVPLRAFTALGQVVGTAIYPFDMGGGFVPFRRDVAYEAAALEVPLRALAPRLRFVSENPAWGMLARRGHFEIGLDDLEVIRAAMAQPGRSGEAERSPKNEKRRFRSGVLQTVETRGIEPLTSAMPLRRSPS
jgi:hypothetical protein